MDAKRTPPRRQEMTREHETSGKAVRLIKTVSIYASSSIEFTRRQHKRKVENYADICSFFRHPKQVAIYSLTAQWLFIPAPRSVKD